MKKTLYALLMLMIMGCSSNPYEKVAREGYGVSIIDSRFLSKRENHTWYYRYNDEEARVYLILERDEISEDIKPLLSLEYRGENWIYMEKVTFTSEEERLEIDFLREKFSRALVQEISKASGSVAERILIPVDDEVIGKLGKLFEAGAEVKTLYSSRYRGRNDEMILTPQEKEGIIIMIKLYNKVKRGES